VFSLQERKTPNTLDRSSALPKAKTARKHHKLHSIKPDLV
jgi:hypothetical protein